MKTSSTPTSKPLISVIMATYNRAHLLPRAIRSVLNQTYKDFEIIVVDDGSTDSTEEVVKTFQDRRILYYKQGENKGMLAARNKGFDVAREIHKDEKLKDVPVIIVSGVRKEMNLAFGFEPEETWLPVKGVLEKPVKPEVLLKTVEENI